MLVLPLGIAWFSAVIFSLLDGRRGWVGWLAVLTLASSCVATLWLAVVVLDRGPIEVVTGQWPARLGITLRADALGVVFALLSSLVLLSALIYEVLVGVRERSLPALVLFLDVGLTGLFLTGDIFNFYVFFEVSMVSAFVLATYGQQPRQLRAALNFTVVNLLGTVLFLSAIAALYHVTGTLEMEGVAARLDTVHSTPVVLIATIIFVAFSLKLGLFPFHFWVLEVYRDTRPAVTAILSGAVANIGSYGLLRFGAGILADELRFSATVLMAIGAASVLYGAHQAVRVATPSEALAYSAIGQAGYILIALAIGGAVGYAAAILYALVNGLNKTLLFLSIGLRGWLVGAAFAIGAFSVSGIPPSVGFLGKAALFRAGIEAPTYNVPLLSVIFLGGALSFIYMIQLFQREFWHHKPREAKSRLGPRVLVITLAGIVVATGLLPELLLSASQSAAAALIGGSPR